MGKNKLQPILLTSLLIAIGSGWCYSVYDLIKTGNNYQVIQVKSALPIFFLRWIVFLLGLIVIASVIRQIWIGGLERIRNISSGWLAIRIALYCFLPAIAVTSLFHIEALDIFEGNGFLIRSVFYSVLLIFLMFWTLWIFLRGRHCPHLSQKNIWGRAGDILCMNLLILLFVGETSLIAFNYYKPSMLFYSSSSDILDRMNSLRMKPGTPYFNFRLNSGGYHDEEFFTAKDSDLVIGLLADSFGLGVVPYEYNFVTIAERELRKRFKKSYQRIAIHNFGIPAVAMSEYAFLLESEVVQTNPSIVVLCIFIGNDIIESQGFGEMNPSRYCLQNWFLWLLPKRLIALTKEKQQQESELKQFNASLIGRLKKSGEIPEYIHDASKEPPTFSKKKFYEVERWRFFESSNPKYPNCQKGFTGIFKGLKYFHKRLGSRLLVVLLPDEFQVNDDLYESIIKNNPSYTYFQRNYPQNRILTYCLEHDIKCVDMLPKLREGQKNGRTFHLQDTHLNAYGNRIVGVELADAIFKSM